VVLYIFLGYLDCKMLKPRTSDTIEDIVALGNHESLARTQFKGRINLREYPDLPKFHADDTYKVKRFNIPNEKDVIDYTASLGEICNEARHTGRHERLFSGLYEALRNAHQHGNQKDSEKAIEIAYRPITDGFEVVVSDEGGKLDASFIPFILMHRQGMLRPLSFYDFAPDTQRLEENTGNGTFVIHMSADEVNYFINYAGGLSVQMIVKISEK